MDLTQTFASQLVLALWAALSLLDLESRASYRNPTATNLQKICKTTQSSCTMHTGIGLWTFGGDHNDTTSSMMAPGLLRA